MATNSKEIIRVEHIVKLFEGGVKALDDCSLSVSRGEVVAIIGPSGSGKSTMLRCLNLLEQPNAGKVLVDGVDITAEKIDLDLHRRKMGMVFQHFNLFPNMTVKKNITLAPVRLKLKTQAVSEPRSPRRRICAVAVLPTLEPNTTGSACDSFMIPAFTKPLTMMVTAAEL